MTAAAWPEVALGDICEFKYGKSLPAALRTGGTAPVYGSNGVVGGHDHALTNGATIVVGRKGSFGEVHYCAESCWPIDTTYFVDSSCTRTDLRWLYWTLPALRLTSLNRAAAIPGLNRDDAYARTLMLPPIEEQRRIASVLDRADALRTKRWESIAMLDSLAESIFLDVFGDPVNNPKGWAMRSFSEVCPTRLGKMLDQKQQTSLESRPYLRNANVQWFNVSVTDLAEMDFSEKDRTEFRVEPGDVLICEGGEPGRAAVWDGQVEEIYFQKALHRGRPDPRFATPTYVVHLLRHLALRGGLVDHISTATIAHLTGARLKAMVVPSPPVSLQHEFEQRLQQVQRSVDRASAHASAFDGLFSSLQQRAFRGDL